MRSLVLDPRRSNRYHSVRANTTKNFTYMQDKFRFQLQPLGSAIRSVRKNKGFTLDQLAEQTGLSAGLISRVENFRVLPSLLVLLRLAGGLEVSLGELVKDITARGGPGYLWVRREDQTDVEREDSVGIGYRAILEASVQAQHFQAGVVTVAPGAKRTPVSTMGDQFIYMLEGTIHFRLGDETLVLNAGDALFFDGRTPHVPENRRKTAAVFLSLYLLHQKQDPEERPEV